MDQQGENLPWCIVQTFLAFFFLLFFFQDIAVYHSDLFLNINTTYLTSTGLSAMQVSQAVCIPSSMVHLLGTSLLIAISWCYYVVSRNEFQGEKELKRGKMSLEIMEYIQKSDLHSPAHNEQEYKASILNSAFNVVCKCICMRECLLKKLSYGLY